MDTFKVKLYRQDGASPNPPGDTLLGTDTSFPGGVWNINTTGWSEGRYTLYAISYDLAGNESGFESKSVGILPYPMQIAGLIFWYVGELDSMQIGAIG
ncbi:MAG: hypothetical protein H8E14_02710 [Candidatus Marinimicrobia bacterium]|nr:hypothetical protein [Candidatus Neomarinimicrobiota bacterium]